MGADGAPERRRDPVRVLAVTGQGPMAPSFRVRVTTMAPELRKFGIETVPLAEFTEPEAERLATGTAIERAMTVVGGRIGLRRRLAEVADASVCLVQRNAAIWPTVAPEREAIGARRFVYDVDDALWIAGAMAGGHPLAILGRGAQRARLLARRADHTIAANAHLADWLERAGGRVTIVPSVVDTRRVAPRGHEDKSDLVVGWIGSRSTAGYLGRLVEPLERFALTRSDLSVRLLVVGGPAPAVKGVGVETRQWSDSAQAAALSEIDVGVMPVPDNPWTRGKSAYKALVYMSAGIPVIADDVGVASEVIGDRDAGALVRSSSEWTEALDWLAGAGARAQLGERGRRRVEQDFSVERWAPVMASIVRGEL